MNHILMRYPSEKIYYLLFITLHKDENYLLQKSFDIIWVFMFICKVLDIHPACDQHTPADHHVITCPGSLTRLKQELNPNPNSYPAP